MHEIKLIVKQILYIKLVKYRDKYTEMQGQQNVKVLIMFACKLHSGTHQETVGNFVRTWQSTAK